jgi:predicted nucleic acid-binding protein
VEVLRTLFGEVLIPDAVASELRHQKAPAIVRAWATQFPNWIRILKPRSRSLSEELQLGESEAISLALETNADLLLLDDLAARDGAEAQGIKTAGVLGVLATASSRGLLDFEETLIHLRATNYRISEKIIQRVRERVRQDRR